MKRDFCGLDILCVFFLDAVISASVVYRNPFFNFPLQIPHLIQSFSTRCPNYN